MAVHYRYDEKGRLTGERRRCITRRRKHCSGSMRPDMLQRAGAGEPLYTGQPARRGMLTYGSGYLAGMKLGDTPLVDTPATACTGKRCAASAVMNSHRLYPCRAVTEPAPEQPAV